MKKISGRDLGERKKLLAKIPKAYRLRVAFLFEHFKAFLSSLRLCFTLKSVLQESTEQ